MDVEVNDRSTPQQSLALQQAHGDGDIVEDAESLAVIGKGVVRATGEVHGNAVPQRGGGRLARPADRAQRALDERGRPGKTNAA